VTRPKDGNADGTPSCDSGSYEALAPGKLQFSAATYSVAENAGTATITVTRTSGSDGAVGATVTPSNGTATAPADYDATARTVSFADGDTTAKTVSIPIVNDTLDEPDETVNLALASPTGGAAVGSPSAAVLTIQDDDVPPTLSINDISVTEGNSGTVRATFTVTLSAATSLTVTVQALTADGTATAGSDYTAIGPTTLTFAAGATSQTFTVPVIGDTLSEADETFVVNLTGAVNATIADAQGLGTIVNDDALPTLSINDVSLPEGNSGTSAFTFAVRLAGATVQTVTVVAQTVDGTAKAGPDYSTVAPVTLTFAPGTTAQPVVVPVIGDTTVEPDETFTVRLSSATNATIADGEGLGTIKNDDAAVVVPDVGPESGQNNNDSGKKADKDDGTAERTEEQRQQHQLTNTSNKDDVYVEGNVIELHADERPPYVVIANRDGLVKVLLYGEAAKAADSIRIGDYLEASGEKQHEQLFEASDVSIKRAR
jgi:hypothetical protein